MGRNHECEHPNRVGRHGEIGLAARLNRLPVFEGANAGLSDCPKASGF